jgi:hypothetical protein
MCNSICYVALQNYHMNACITNYETHKPINQQ